MDLIHRVTLSGPKLTPQNQVQLEALGVATRDVRRRTIFLTLRDDDPEWPWLQELVLRTGGRDLPVRTFTNGERNVSQWLAITPVSHHGWPGTKPIRDSLHSLFATHTTDHTANDSVDHTANDSADHTANDSTDHTANDSVVGTTICPDCESTRGTRGASETPLCFAKEPSWQKTDFLQIDGFRDLWFTRPEIYHEVFEPFGVRARPVVRRATGEPLRTVVELVPTMEDVPLRLPENRVWETVQCPTCDAIRFDVGGWGGWVPERGVLPPLDEGIPDTVHFLTTRQRFTATTIPREYSWRLCLISQPLFRAIRFRHLRGIASEPIGWEE